MKVINGDWSTKDACSIQRNLLNRVVGLRIGSDVIKLSDLFIGEIDDAKDSTSARVGAAAVGALIAGPVGLLMGGLSQDRHAVQITTAQGRNAKIEMTPDELATLKKHLAKA